MTHKNACAPRLPGTPSVLNKTQGHEHAKQHDHQVRSKARGKVSHSPSLQFSPSMFDFYRSRMTTVSTMEDDSLLEAAKQAGNNPEALKRVINALQEMERDMSSMSLYESFL